MDIPRLLGGRYEITQLLRTGHLTQVHEAFDRRDQRQVAVEILRSVHCHDQAILGRFRTAGHVAAGLTHPHVAQVKAAGEAQGLGFFVRELVDGPTLRDVLTAEGRLPAVRGATIALQVCQALSFAHRVGVLHGGLNPSDILMTAAGDVKVTGFGVADSVGTVESLDARYIAPEQAQHLGSDARADLYALGCCLYEMLLGRPPFAGDPQMLERVKSRVPPQLGDILRRLLAVQPEDRYQAASETIIDLRRYLESEGGAPPEEPQPRSRSERREGAHRAAPPRAAGADSTVSDATRRALNRTAVLATVCLLLAGTIAVTTNVIDFGSELTVGSERVEEEGDGGVDPSPDAVDGSDGQSDSSLSSGSSTTTESSTTSTTESTTTTSTTEPEEEDPGVPDEGGNPTPTTEPPPGPPDPTTTTESRPTVPNVVGMSEDEAASTLASHGLRMATSHVRVYDGNQDGRVVSQNPGGGAPQPEDGTVRVEVGQWCVLIC